MIVLNLDESISSSIKIYINAYLFYYLCYPTLHTHFMLLFTYTPPSLTIHGWLNTHVAVFNHPFYYWLARHLLNGRSLFIFYLESLCLVTWISRKGINLDNLLRRSQAAGHSSVIGSLTVSCWEQQPFGKETVRSLKLNNEN